MHVSSLKNLKTIESSLGYRFNNHSLLLEAVTHSSYSNEHPGEAPDCNERLEFFGDAVLGLVIVEELFNSEERLSESEMAKLKSYLVSKTVLYDSAKRLNLSSALYLGKGEESSGGRSKDNILTDALEALMGAVFLDSDYATARKVILKILEKNIRKTLETGKAHDYKTDLQEMTQGIFSSLPEYKLVREEGEEHDKTFTVEVLAGGAVMGRGTGRSKKDAQMKAAKEAIARLGKRN